MTRTSSFFFHARIPRIPSERLPPDFYYDHSFVLRQQIAFSSRYIFRFSQKRVNTKTVPEWFARFGGNRRLPPSLFYSFVISKPKCRCRNSKHVVTYILGENNNFFRFSAIYNTYGFSNYSIRRIGKIVGFNAQKEFDATSDVQH